MCEIIDKDNPETIVNMIKDINYHKNKIFKHLLYVNNFECFSNMWSFIVMEYKDEYLYETTEKMKEKESEYYQTYLLLKNTCIKNNVDMTVSYSMKHIWETEITYNISLNIIDVLINDLLINNNILSIDEQTLIGYSFLNNYYNFSIHKTTEEKLRNNFSLIISSIGENKEKIKNLLKIDEDQLMKNFFANKYISIIPEYIDKEVWSSLNFDVKKTMKMVIKKYNTKNYYTKHPKWRYHMMAFYEPNLWVENNCSKSYFGLFNFLGYSLEEATTIIFPEKYNKGIKRKHINRGYSITIKSSLEKQFDYIKPYLNEKIIKRDELIDWYQYIIKGELLTIFQSTVEILPLNYNELQDPIMMKLMNRILPNKSCNWSQQYLNITLNNNLKEQTTTKKIKI